MHHSLARAHGGATGVLDRVVRALNPSAARGSGWRYQPGWYHGDRFRPQRTEAAVFCNERRLLGLLSLLGLPGLHAL